MCGLNHLFGCVGETTQRATPAQMNVCVFLIDEAEDFLKRVPELGPLNWKDFLRVKTIDYKGEEVRTAQSTTWSNLKNALPDEAARVPLEEVKVVKVNTKRGIAPRETSVFPAFRLPTCSCPTPHTFLHRLANDVPVDVLGQGH